MVIQPQPLSMFRRGRLFLRNKLKFIRLTCLFGSFFITYCLFNHIYLWHLSRRIGSSGYLPENFNSSFNPKSMFVTRTAPPGDHHSETVNSIKTILVWTTFFGQKDWVTNKFTECDVKACNVSLDKTDLKSADAVTFHPRNIQPNDWPSIRSRHQRWILFSMEPPFYNNLDYATYNNVFNWTMMLRRDSDFPISYTQGDFHLTENSNLWQDRTKLITSRPRLVTARISNCLATTSPRLDYIEELRKYIPVDVYGKCGNLQCNKDCIQEMRMYKFYLSFENGFCRNYITEKFWLPFSQFSSVPVVMGGAHVNDYKEIAPPHSYINVADFSSPEQLANYLVLLDKSPLQYSEFFKWQLRTNNTRTLEKAAASPGLSSTSPWCDVCKSLHDPSLTWQYYNDLDGWFKEDTCMTSSRFKPTHNVYFSAALTSVALWIIVFLLLLVFIKLSRNLICISYIYAKACSLYPCWKTPDNNFNEQILLM